MERVMIEGNGIYTLKEVSAYFGVDPQTITKLALRGKLGAFKMGVKWLFKGSKVLEYMETEPAKLSNGYKNRQ